MEHIHQFKNIGGGQRFHPENEFDFQFPCDDDYRCECGIRFTVRTDGVGHKYLPEHYQFDEGEMSEAKKAEQSAIKEALPKDTV